jgi:hypothetical protein
MPTNTFLPGRTRTVFVQATITDNFCHTKVYRRSDMKQQLAERMDMGSGRELWKKVNEDISSGQFVIDLEAK